MRVVEIEVAPLNRWENDFYTVIVHDWKTGAEFNSVCIIVRANHIPDRFKTSVHHIVDISEAKELFGSYLTNR